MIDTSTVVTITRCAEHGWMPHAEQGWDSEANCYRTYCVEYQPLNNKRCGIPVEQVEMVPKPDYDALLGEVREWVCDKCNTVYPGPPSEGVTCVLCPRCDGFTMSKPLYEKRRAEAERDALRQRLAAAEKVIELAKALVGSGAVGEDLKDWGRPEYQTFDSLAAALTNYETEKSDD